MRLGLLYVLFVSAFSSNTLSAQSGATKEQVNIYFYHDKPPLVVDKEKGLGQYFEIVNCLNSHSADYHFKPAYVPKPRIEHMISINSFNALVIGVHPNWFKDRQREKYLWSSAVLTDQDEFVSLTSKPFDFINKNSFDGKRVGGVRGFFYKGINESIQQKSLTRVDTINEKALLYMLLTQRIDFAIVSRSTLIYYNQNRDFTNKFHLSTVPHDSFTRHIMLPKKRTKLLNQINALIGKQCAF